MRLDLLRRVAVAPSSVTELSVGVGLSLQEVARHLGRLGDVGLARRGTGRAYEATPFGRVMLEELPAFGALLGRRPFFDTHALDGVPQGLTVAPLARAEHAEASESENMERFLGEIRRAGGPVRYAGNQLGWAAPALCAAASAGWEVELVLPWSLAGSESLLALDDGLGEAAARVAVRLVAGAPLLLAITPAAGVAFFPTRGGGMDFRCLLRGDGAFQAWALDVFTGLRARSVLAHDPTSHVPGDWRRSIATAAGSFIGRPRLPV